jgi:hypothetical protein
VDSGEGYPSSVDLLAANAISLSGCGTILILGDPPSSRLNPATKLIVKKRAAGTHDTDEGISGNSYFCSHRSCCRIGATQDSCIGLRWVRPCRVLSFSDEPTETKFKVTHYGHSTLAKGRLTSISLLCFLPTSVRVSRNTHALRVAVINELRIIPDRIRSN